jgi:hypothetical protein
MMFQRIIVLSTSELSSPRSAITLQDMGILYICKDNWGGEAVGVVELCAGQGLSGLTGKSVTECRLGVRSRRLNCTVSSEVVGRGVLFYYQHYEMLRLSSINGDTIKV